MIAQMDIRDAVTLFIAPNSYTPTRGSENGEALFKITEDGVIKQVTFVDEQGKEITEEYMPSGITVIDNSPYFFVRFYYSTYMVNKATGNVYEAPDIGTGDAPIGVQDGDINFANEKTIKADKYGNIYYKYGSQIHKIDVSNANAIVDEGLTPQSDNISMYVVSDSGELLYRYYSNGDRFHRLRTTSGRLIPFELFGSGIGFDYLAFCGLDGNIHVFDRRALYSITFNGDDSYEINDIIVDDCNESGTSHGSCIANTVYEMGGYPYLVKLPDRYLAISSDGAVLVIDSKSDKSIITGKRYDITDGTEVAYDIINGMKISQLEYNDSYVYCCGHQRGNYCILRFNPYTFESEIMVRDNDYEIYSFVVQDDNTIFFNGLRLSDGKNILATIDNNGKVKVLEETGNTRVVLYRLQ